MSLQRPHTYDLKSIVLQFLLFPQFINNGNVKDRQWSFTEVGLEAVVFYLFIFMKGV